MAHGGDARFVFRRVRPADLDLHAGKVAPEEALDLAQEVGQGLGQVDAAAVRGEVARGAAEQRVEGFARALPA